MSLTQAQRDRHLHNCDYLRQDGAPGSECYCPLPGETITRECGHLVDIECGCHEG